jgi:hypothetical protein
MLLLEREALEFRSRDKYALTMDYSPYMKNISMCHSMRSYSTKQAIALTSFLLALCGLMMALL